MWCGEEELEVHFAAGIFPSLLGSPHKSRLLYPCCTCCSRALIKTMPYLQGGPPKSVMSLQYFFSAVVSFNIGSEIRYIQLLLSIEMKKYPIIWLLRLQSYAVPFMYLIFLLLPNLEALRYRFDPVFR